MRPGEARRILESYTFLSLRDRLAIIARLVFCAPSIMGVLEQCLPKRGLVMDLGCGYGVISHLLATERPGRMVLGFDISSHRISIARQSTYHSRNVEFYAADIREVQIPRCDAVIMIDILYMFSHQHQEQLLTRCYEGLNDGGVLVIKDSCKSPYWKYVCVYAEEMIKTRLGLYGREIKRPSLNFRDVNDLLKLLRKTGFHASSVRAKSPLPYPGVFYICQKRPVSAELLPGGSSTDLPW